MADNLLRLLLRGTRPIDGLPAGGLSDAELLERFVSQRDAAAFEVLLWRHGPMVLGVCRRLLRHEHDAEDAFQATFLTLAKKAGSIGRREACAAWLHRVACHVALNARAATAVRTRRERPWRDVAAGDDHDDLVWRDLRPVLDEEVRRLPAKYRTPFVLCYLEGKTNDEAARQLGCPTGTVLSRLARARERLRTCLTRRGVTLSAGALAVALAGSASAASVPAGLVETIARAVSAVSAGKAVAAVAGGRVAALMQGVLRTMFFAKLRVVLAVVLATGVSGLGVGTLIYWPVGTAKEPPVALPEAQAAPAAGGPADPDDVIKRAARLARSQQNLKQIGLALHNYHAAYGHFPPPAIYSRDGKPLLSWRVAILPFLEQDNLFKLFKLDEPWDSPHNRALLKHMPDTYAPVVPTAGERDRTYYQAIVGKGAAFEPQGTVRAADILDGTSNTIAVAEAATPVPWTKPEDLAYAADQPLPRFGGLFDGDFNALFLDGEILLLSRKADEKMLRAALTRAGGEPQSFEGLLPPKSDGHAGSPPDLQRLATENTGLRLALQVTGREVAKLREDLQLMRAKAARGLPGAEDQAAKLRRENEQLLDELGQLLSKLDELKAEKQRLEKALGERSKERP
jgi:RNA polymerase sigma factor (sigma-70 family)